MRNLFESRLTRISAPTRFGELLNGETFRMNSLSGVDNLAFTKFDSRRAVSWTGGEWIRPKHDDAVTLIETVLAT